LVEELKYADEDIARQSGRVRELTDEVQSLESAVKETKADLTASKERLATARRELQSMIDDRAKGQRRLKLSGDPVAQVIQTTADAINNGAIDIPGCTVTAEVGSPEESATGVVDEHASDPISVLGQKDMIALAGQDAWESAKNRDEPFGMAKGELAILEENEITTIRKLEKTMRENEWWHRDIKKFGEKKVAKLIETLRVFRGKYPQPA
jgi:outer membrane murein-binding lipoprotein Lpp